MTHIRYLMPNFFLLVYPMLNLYLFVIGHLSHHVPIYHKCTYNNMYSIIQEQIILRENAIEQSDLLMEYKRLFVRHSSHHYAFQNQKPGGNNKKANNKRGTGLLSIFTSFLDEPLSKVGSSRTSSDHLIIELVLHLIRNLLSISPINTYGSPEKAQYASQLQHDLLVVLQEEMVLDVLVCVGQEIERRENTGYNLLMMEIISHLLRGMVSVIILIRY